MAKRRVHRDDRVPPTAQTVANLAPVYAVLLRQGQPNEVELELACDEIQLVYEAITRCRSQSFAGTDHGQAGDPLSRMTAHEETLWRFRYRPWAHIMASHRIGATRQPQPTQLQLTHDLVCDNRSPASIAVMRGVGPNAVKTLVLDALNEYLRIVRR